MMLSSRVLNTSVQWLARMGSSYQYQTEHKIEKYSKTAPEDSQIVDTDMDNSRIEQVDKEKKIESTDGYEI